MDIYSEVQIETGIEREMVSSSIRTGQALLF